MTNPKGDPKPADRDPDDWADPFPLHSAAGIGDVAAVRRLIAAGHVLDSFDDCGGGFTPLHHAAVGERLEVVACLIEAGADVNRHAEAVIGETPLGQVAGSCSLALARLLIAGGADPTIPGWMRLTALERAARRRRFDGPAVHQLLIDAARGLGRDVPAPRTPTSGVGKRQRGR